MGGTYVLGIAVERETTIEVGALGSIDFAPGTYAYVGSAFGPGGFSRVERHRELADGERETRHWHVDYLLGHPHGTLEAAVTFPNADRECDLARSLPGRVVPDFGASDCDCTGHLLATTDADPLAAAVEDGGRLERF